MKISLTLLVITALLLNNVIGWEWISSCIAHTGSSCETKCNDHSDKTRQCSYKDWNGYFFCKECVCECYNFDACKWCGDCNANWCITESTIKGDCNYQDVIKLPGLCNIGKLEKVDEEINKQIAWNLGGVAADALGIGMSAVYAVFNPTGPVTSAFSLNNALRTELNTKITELQSCMDTKISNAIINTVWTKELKSMLAKFDAAKGATGDEYSEDINDLFTDLIGEIAGIFDKQSTHSYWEYESMLPLYQTFLNTLWIPVAKDQLIIQRTKPDRECTNYYNDVRLSKQTLNVLNDWILDARESIKSSLTPPTYDNKCDITGDASKGTITTTGDAFEGDCYHKNGIMFCDQAHGMDKIWNVDALMSSEERGKICEFEMTGRGSDWPDLPHVDEANARICKTLTKFDQLYRKPIIDRIPEWTKSFNDKYIVSLEKYIISLEKVEPCQ